MTKIYISSTYSDLKDYREAVHSALRKMKLDVITMEDYVAVDERPLEKCLADVSTCDLYVGIIAFRYGFIPTNNNPKGLSITELEYRHALAEKKKCLMFLLDEEVPWLPTHIDHGAAWHKIDALRTSVKDRHSVGFFKNEATLAAAVVQAVYGELQTPQPPRVQTQVSHQPREICFHSFATYYDVDENFAKQLASQLGKAGIGMLLSPQALFAEKAADFSELEKQIRQCRTSLVVLSDVALNQMEEASARTERILKILKDRTGRVIGGCLTASSLDRATRWNLDRVIDLSQRSQDESEIPFASTREITKALSDGPALESVKMVGLPFVVVAMTRNEAVQISENPQLIEGELPQSYKQFCALREALESSSHQSFCERYGDVRESWKPFVGSARTVNGVIEEIIKHLNRRPDELHNRLIKAQYYSFDELTADDSDLLPVYEEISQTGCVVLLDEFSMFQPSLRRAFQSSPLAASNQVALVTLSPFEPYSMIPNKGLEGELRPLLMYAFKRFADMYDARYEFSIGDEQRLKRWLHSNLPMTLMSLQDLRPNHNKLDLFAQNRGGKNFANILYS